MAATSKNYTTPINRINRDDLPVLIRNNTLNESLEFMSDNERMETGSPVRSNNLQPISKKLFHSPLQTPEPEVQSTRNPEDRSRQNRKRKQLLIPDANERFKRAYIQCEGDGYSEGGMRKKVLISLFHNKEYSMDVEV